MVYCKAFGCNYNGKEEGVHRHSFPKEPKILKLWIAKINREDFREHHVTKSSMLCSKHFVDSDYVTSPALLKSLNFKKQPKLKLNAVPSVFPHKPQKDRISNAREKRERQEVLKETLQETYAQPHSTTYEDPTDPVQHASYISEAVPSKPVDFNTKSVHTYTETSVMVDKKILHRPQMHDKGNQTKFRQKHVEVQTLTQLKEASIQCELLKDSNVEEEDMEIENNEDENEDPDWLPGQILDEEDETDEHEFEIGDTLLSNPCHLQERKFLVYESCLYTLLSLCVLCMLPCRVMLACAKGSWAKFRATCLNGHTREWETQPMSGSLPRGNLDIAGAILYSGSTAAKAVNMMKHLKMFTITTRTFLRLQKHYLIPAVFQHWTGQQRLMLQEMQRGPHARLAADGRYDSSGHLAKYMSYSMLNVRSGAIVMVQVLQKNECKSTNAMELEGFKRSMEELKRCQVPVESVVTDRHLGIRKSLREEFPTIRHWFDIWHVAKSLRKKVLQAAKRRTCDILQKWVRGICNHLYFCATTSGGDGALAKAKFISILRHVVNEHTGHGSLYDNCLHGDLSDEPRMWLTPGSKSIKELEAIITNKRLLKDVEQLSPYEQTASIESYHRVVCFFAPKALHFFYSAMKARILLAALHFNENSRRAQRATKDGKLQFAISYQKYAMDRGVVKEVKVSCTYDYISELMKIVYELRHAYPTYKEAAALVDQYTPEDPGTITSGMALEKKEELVAKHVSRYSQRP